MNLFKSLFLALFLLSLSPAISQDVQGDATLSNQYLELKEKSNNYQIYKVVKETSLDEFWKSVKDSLQVSRTEIESLKSQVKSLQEEVSDLKEQVAQRDSSLADQAHMIEHMNFLGLSLTKSTYVIFTWIVIFALLIAAVVLYFRFKSANRITVQTRKEHQNLQEEFEAHKQRARESETKLKRELQTEINRVEELKAQLGES